jgi:P27 family predicted phage terminase small subunit
MARPRQPTDLLIVKGKKHLTKDEIADRKSKEVKAPADNVQAPSYLLEFEGLKEEFDRIASELIEIGIMSNLDCDALANFIVEQHQYEKISIKMLKMKSFGPRYRDLQQIQKDHYKNARASASDLGLTISSRCKLVVPKKSEDDKPKNKFSKFAK